MDWTCSPPPSTLTGAILAVMERAWVGDDFAVEKARATACAELAVAKAEQVPEILAMTGDDASLLMTMFLSERGLVPPTEASLEVLKALLDGIAARIDRPMSQHLPTLRCRLSGDTALHRVVRNAANAAFRPARTVLVLQMLVERAPLMLLQCNDDRQTALELWEASSSSRKTKNEVDAMLGGATRLYWNLWLAITVPERCRGESSPLLGLPVDIWRDHILPRTGWSEGWAPAASPRMEE